MKLKKISVIYTIRTRHGCHMLLPYPGIDLGNLEEALRHEELVGGMICG